MKAIHHVLITPKQILLDGEAVSIEGEGAEMLRNVYKERIGDYPKYYKMDGLCRLGFVASELLLQAEGERLFDEKGRVQPSDARDDRAVILFNRSSSLCDDVAYQATIANPDDYYPSPGIFVYTLPNILTGEIAIRNGYHGETCFYVLPDKDEAEMEAVIRESFLDETTRSALCGWVDCEDDDTFEADLYLMEI